MLEWLDADDEERRRRDLQHADIGCRGAGARLAALERPCRVAAVLEHLHGGEGGVGEATEGVAAALACR